MRRGLWWSIAAVLVALPEFAWAIETGVDARLAYYRWEEEVEPITPLETGPMVFVGGWLAGSPISSTPAVRLRGDLRVLVGSVDYETALITAPSTPISTETEYVGSFQEASVGWRIQQPRGFFEPFGALAFRWWLRSIKSNSTVLGYDERYYTLVGRLGVRGELRASKNSAAYWELSGDPMLWAREEIDLEDAFGETLRVSNGKRMGWTVETGWRAGAGDVGVFWQAVRFGESDVVPCSISPSGCLQPKSNQDIVGVKAALTF